MQRQIEITRKKAFAWTPRKRKLIIIGALVLMAIGFLTFQTFQSASSFLINVTELKAASVRGDNKDYRVTGTVIVTTIIKDPVNRTMSFSITDGTSTLPVIYRGGVTSQFYQEDSDIVIEGRLDKNGTFVASNVLTRHVSKFTADQPAK